MTTPSAAAVSAYQFYLSKGIGNNIAAGIPGVLSYESGMNPLAMNNTGTDAGGVLNPKGAIGLAQWNGSRQGNGSTGLADFAQQKGLNWQDASTQLMFILTECANSFPDVWAAIQSNMDVTDFVSLFVRKYENPADPTPEITAGLAVARALLAIPPAPIPIPVPVPVPTPPPPPAPTGDAELEALTSIYTTLLTFPATTQKRLMDYLTSRFGT